MFSIRKQLMHRNHFLGTMGVIDGRYKKRKKRKGRARNIGSGDRLSISGIILLAKTVVMVLAGT